jgi:hypothetical protein
LPLVTQPPRPKAASLRVKHAAPTSFLALLALASCLSSRRSSGSSGLALGGSSLLVGLVHIGEPAPCGGEEEGQSSRRRSATFVQNRRTSAVVTIEVVGHEDSSTAFRTGALLAKTGHLAAIIHLVKRQESKLDLFATSVAGVSRARNEGSERERRTFLRLCLFFFGLVYVFFLRFLAPPSRLARACKVLSLCTERCVRNQIIRLPSSATTPPSSRCRLKRRCCASAA